GLVGVAALAGAAGLAALAEGGTARFFRSYLVAYMFFLSLALGGMVFTLLQHLTRAGWSVAVRRLAEVTAWTVTPLTVLGLVLLGGMRSLYPWTHAEIVAADPLLQGKQAWLNVGFFVARFAGYFLVWNVAAQFFLRRSLHQDRTGDPALTLQMERAAPPATILYGVTVTFAVFDWVMSLYPHWYSTIFGVYYFAGCMIGFLALAALALFALQGRGQLAAVSLAHYHDLGKLLFAFVVFWGYVAFSQYMLIWYANIPEETAWYRLRQEGGWGGVGALLIFGHFVVPFLVLLSRHPKRRRAGLAAAAAWLLVAHWFDLYYLIMPEASPGSVPLSLVDLGCTLGLGGLFGASLLWRLERVELIPVRDPRLEESLGYESL
ncbi:MAG TPA: hypothetical protein VJS92_00660, partial [Candidatus Polarisedimenticolaceae bacterium]|nr:hypothetical protein [Candidatus Polarisedimenticolaceae bacterium]